MFNRPRLLAPGPVEVDPEVLHVLAGRQIHHRTPEAREAVLTARSQLSKLLGAPEYEVLILTSSGTGAFEAAMLSLLPEGAKVLCAEAGKFGKRWGLMAEKLGYSVDYLSAPWGTALNPEAVAAQSKNTAAVFITHSETSTGVLHDLEAISKAVKAQNPSTLIFVDAVTSFAVAELRPEAWNLDVIVSGSQKGVAAPPGLGFVMLSPTAVAILGQGNPRRYYFDLAKEIKSQKDGETAQTPAINIIQALGVSTARLTAVPLEQLWQEKAKMNNALVQAGLALGCSNFAERTSPATAALVPPEGYTGKQVADALKKLGARAAAGQDAFKDSMFRISLMGFYDRYDALAVAGLMEDAFASLGYEFSRGVAVNAAWQALQ